MALVYSIRCESCEQERGCVDLALAIQLPDGSVTILGHPGEDSQLEALGYTFHRAAAEARLLHVTWSVCRLCGGLCESHKRRDLVANAVTTAWGCVGALAFLAALASAPSNRRIAAAFLVIAIATFTFALAISTVSRIRHARRAPGLPELPGVPCCAASAPRSRVPVPEASAKERFPCPDCGERAVLVEAVAIS